MMFQPAAFFSFDALAAWLVTFFIHSSLLVLGAWFLSKFLVPQRYSFQEIAWKTAIVMGLFTASLQLGLHFSPASFISKNNPATMAQLEENNPFASTKVPFSLDREMTTPIPTSEKKIAAEEPAALPLPISETRGFAHIPWQKTLIWLWFAGAAFFLIKFAGNLFWLHRMLADRTLLQEGPLFEQLQNIRASAHFRQKVALSISDRIQVPIAFGLISPEICVPRQAITKLGPGQQATMLAHELAHLIHRDPHWLRLVHLMQAVFFIQPLFRLAQRQLNLLAEIRCDDWAVQNLGQPRDLAHCLTEVAGWSLNTKRRLPVPGMAKGGSILQKRVERLLRKNQRVVKSQSWLFRAMIIGGLGLMAMATPGLLPAEPVIAPAPPVPAKIAQQATPAVAPAPLVATESAPEPRVAALASPVPQPMPLARQKPSATLAIAPAKATAAPKPQIARAQAAPIKPIAKKAKAAYGEWGDKYNNKRHKEMRELVIDAPSTLVVDGGKNGGISVKGWNRSEVKIVAKVEVFTEESEDAEAMFNEIQVIADDRIYAEGPRREPWSVSFEIFAPFQTNVDLETHNGGISLHDLSGTLEFKALNGGIRLVGLSGDVRGRTTNGGLKVTLDGDQWDGTGLDVQTTNGGISLEIPEGYNAQLQTGTVNGRMDFQFPVMVKGQINKNFKTTLGKGGPSIRVRTTNGSVQVKR